MDDTIFFHNLAELMDADGEYWFDDNTKQLYVYNPSGDYAISRSGTFMTLNEGADYLSFVGLELNCSTENAIVSYGERMSSRIVTAALPGAVRKNSLQFIRTEHKQGQVLLNTELTEQLIRHAFSPIPHLSVVPGFISRDSQTDEITNLGRGGCFHITQTLDGIGIGNKTGISGHKTIDIGPNLQYLCA